MLNGWDLFGIPSYGQPSANQEAYIDIPNAFDDFSNCVSKCIKVYVIGEVVTNKVEELAKKLRDASKNKVKKILKNISKSYRKANPILTAKDLIELEKSIIGCKDNSKCGSRFE